MMQDKFERAFHLHTDGQLDAARPLYEEIVATDPGHFDALHLLGLLCHQTGASKEAERFLKTALEMKPGFNQIHSNYARVLHDQRRLEEALAHFDRAIYLKPDDADAYFDRGALLQDMQRLAEALTDFDKAIAIKSDYPMACNNRGVILRDLHRFAEALDTYDQAITLDPSYALAYSNKGSTLKASGRLQEALANYDLAVSIDRQQADIHYNRGNCLIELDRLHEAHASLSNAIAINDKHVEACFSRGNALQKLGRFDDAISDYDQAILLRQQFAQVHSSRGEALRSLGRTQDALSAYDKAICIDPSLSEAYFNRANVLKANRVNDQALASFDMAIHANPHFAEAFLNRATLLKTMSRVNESLESYDQCVAIRPDYAEAFVNRGDHLMDMGLYEEALESYEKAIAARADYAEAHINKGNANYSLKRFAEALKNYHAAVAIRPDYPEGFMNIGATLVELGQFQKALIFYKTAITLKPDYADAYNNLALALKDAKRYDEALILCERSLAIRPSYAQAHNNRGVILKELRQFDEALDCFQAALRSTPSYFSAHSNLLFTMNYMDQVPIPERLRQARLFGANVSTRAREKFNTWRNGDAPEKTRLGFVSGDFGNHPVGYFLEGLLANLDTSKFELVGYTTESQEDNLTVRLKELFQLWRPLYAMSDKAAAKMIHEDAIHILIDLSGHTAKNRLPVFAFKPAPVQVSWLGYFATTGVQEMDYFLGDPHVTPPEEEHHFTEQIKRLPETYLCFTPPATQIAVGRLPALDKGYVTFGSFNNFSKINAAVIALWAKVLHAVTGSRLFMKAAQFDDPDVVLEATGLFAAHGVASDRLIFEGQTSRADYFRAYNKVDIALDPFPYPGGTTSVEGLWMGVPVIARRGTCFIAHNGETIARNCGQAHWIASDDDDYLRKAVFFASDLPALAITREGLRRQVTASPLCDAARFARHFEQVVTDMWIDYKVGKQPEATG